MDSLQEIPWREKVEAICDSFSGSGFNLSGEAEELL